MKITIRPMRQDDVQAVAQLSGQLGYPTTPNAVNESFGLIRQDPHQEVFVAEAAAKTVGWIHVERILSLSTVPRASLGGLIVDECYRGKGIGTDLIARAEEWAKARGLKGLRLSSRVTRTDAHRLYERLGYQIQKTSHVFTKAFE